MGLGIPRAISGWVGRHTGFDYWNEFEKAHIDAPTRGAVAIAEQGEKSVKLRAQFRSHEAEASEVAFVSGWAGNSSISTGVQVLNPVTTAEQQRRLKNGVYEGLIGDFNDFTGSNVAVDAWSSKADLSLGLGLPTDWASSFANYVDPHSATLGQEATPILDEIVISAITDGVFSRFPLPNISIDLPDFKKWKLPEYSNDRWRRSYFSPPTQNAEMRAQLLREVEAFMAKQTPEDVRLARMIDNEAARKAATAPVKAKPIDPHLLILSDWAKSPNNPLVRAHIESTTGIARTSNPSRLVFQGMEVRAVRKLSHVSEGTLRAMAEHGFAAKDINGVSLSLHHLEQRALGPVVEIPTPRHNMWNKIQHPLGNERGAGLTVDERAAFNAWRPEYWKARASEELLRRGLTP